MNTENDKIIAEFMGYEFFDGDFKVPHTNKTSNSDFKEWCPTYWDNDLDSGGYLVAPCNLMFHSDWNWLMEVVEKIKKETNEDEFLNRLITTETRKAIDLELTLENCFRKSYLSIEEVYNACVEFIKWYNENK
jgi:hypothetical protein